MTQRTYLLDFHKIYPKNKNCCCHLKSQMWGLKSVVGCTILYYHKCVHWYMGTKSKPKTWGHLCLHGCKLAPFHTAVEINCSLFLRCSPTLLSSCNLGRGRRWIATILSFTLKHFSSRMCTNTRLKDFSHWQLAWFFFNYTKTGYIEH